MKFSIRKYFKISFLHRLISEETPLLISSHHHRSCRHNRKPFGIFKIVQPKERQGKQHSVCKYSKESRAKAKGKKEEKRAEQC